MPEEVEAAVERAVRAEAVKVIVLRGAGRAFCAGYDFGGGFHHWDEALTTGASGTRARTSSPRPPRRRHRS
jgi:enoyl-CoA hydratase